MDRLYNLPYKASCAIKNSKEPLNDVTLFVRSLINANDEADATYSESDSEYGNDGDIEDDYYDDKEGIFDDLEYDDSYIKEEEDQDDAIDFSSLSEKFYVLLKKE